MSIQAEECPNKDCNNQGWYPEMQWIGVDEYGNDVGEPVQIQCEFCYTNPNSIFNLNKGGDISNVD